MYGEYTRNRILALANANKTPTEIVSILREENIIIVRTTVARIIRRTREKMQGQQHPDRRGRPRKATSPVKRKIDEVYRRDPEVNASELKNVLENELPGIRIGVSTIKMARKAAGWICTQTRYCQMVRDANKIKRLEFCRKIIETNDDFGNVIFTDESSVEIERATTIRFHKQGEMYKPTPKPKHPLKVHVWGGISKHGPTELVIFEGIMDAVLYCQILETSLLPFIRNRLPAHRFQQDNDPKHTSRYAKQFYIDNNVNWWETPPESPDLNPIELLWHELKWYIRKHVKPKTKEELVTGIRQFWTTRVTAEKCRRYINHVRTKVVPRVVELQGQATGM